MLETAEFPEEVQYLLIGGGTATYSAMRAIRKRDVTAKVRKFGFMTVLFI